VLTHLEVNNYNKRRSDGGFDKAEFYNDPSGYESSFPRYAHAADMYIACHYFGEGSPFLYTREDIRHPNWKVKVVADVSCDVDGPVASTLRASTIADPFYGYDPITETVVDHLDENAIAVMAIDNLPCELPYNASEDFGDELIKHVLPLLIEGDRDNTIAGATQTLSSGTLAPKFAYLADYVAKGRRELVEKGLL
jgi:alanine dehydrogenase